VLSVDVDVEFRIASLFSVIPNPAHTDNSENSSGNGQQELEDFRGAMKSPSAQWAFVKSL
jgi:hypothetical protein